MASAKGLFGADLGCRFVLALLTLSGRAEQLPIRIYGPADGFPSKTVEAIIQDSRGFLWFATREGLAQFDGYEFRTYGKANGLPRDAIADFLETRSGIYWAATGDGVAKFNPDERSARKFTVYRPDRPVARRMNVLYEDRSAQVWCGTEDGLFLLKETQDKRSWRLEPVPLNLDSGRTPVDSRISSLFEDSRGNLWVGTVHALYVRRRDGRVSEFQMGPRVGYDFQWNAIFEDSEDRLWAGTGFGLWRILPQGSEYTLFPVFVPKRRLIIWSMHSHPAGGFWLGTSDGLMHWTPAPDGRSGEKRVFTQANGLSHSDVGVVATDREGNLWLGAAGGGVMRVARNGFITYTDVDRVNFARNVDPALFHDRSGEVYVSFKRVINVRRGDRFVEIAPALPVPSNGYRGWAWHQAILRDKAGEWWFATGTGLVRFPNVPVEALPRTHPLAVYTTRDGLQTSDIFRVFEDSSGGIWIGCIGPLGVNGLSRRDGRSGSFQHFPDQPKSVASSFAEDRDRSVWIGYYDGTLGRYRNGTLSFYTTEDGLAGGSILAVHVDHAGRLWIASTRGLTRVDSTGANSPRFLRFSTADGLSSNVMLCLAEDKWGRIYVATGRGIDRIDATGEVTPSRVRHFTEADGLAKGDLIDMLFDSNGDLWCSTRQGISRFTPEPDRSRPPLPILIRGLRIRGVPYPLSDLGETGVPRLTFAPDQNQLQIDFSTLAFTPGEPIKYQYRLDPADDDWSEPSDQRTLNLSNVAPGSYRFSVRVVTASVIEPQHPATLDFTVLAPVWQRWWLRLTVISAFLALIYWLHHYRTLKVLELERVRTRIATDLHDDIGSGLSQIAVLSEVARAQADGKTSLQSALSNIGTVSRELSESMSDIVWSVNPRRDRLPDLTQRMRRFASDILSGGNIEFSFQTPSVEQAVPLPADVRREVFLIFKEAINNLVRHSRCTRAEIEVAIADHWMTLRVEDDGTGFPERSAEEGNGLRSMSERAKRIGATFAAEGSALGGVRVLIRVPLRTSVLHKRIPT